MFAEFHISDPKSNIVLKFQYRIFVQAIHLISYLISYISYSVIDDLSLLGNIIFLKKYALECDYSHIYITYVKLCT